MYGNMQESGLTGIIPLIGTSDICSPYLVFSHPEFPQGSPWGVAAVTQLLDGRYFFLPVFPSGLTSSVLVVTAILWTEDPGGLQSMGSLRVRHD